MVTMADRPKTLSAAFVKTVKRPGRYGDGRGGHGLSLLVKTASTGRLSKSWAQRLRLHGKPFDIGLGSYPRVSLALARARALENAQGMEQGLDPRAKPSAIPTFTEAIEQVIAIHAETWRSAITLKRWRATLGTYATPRLGDKPVSEITTADVMAVLTPIWNTKPETGRKVRQRMGAVMKWAVAQGYRVDNPAGDAIGAALPKTSRRVEHHRAIPFADVGAAITTIRDSRAWPGTKLAFEFLTLTATRSGETRLAKWSEIDEKTATWTIPASRMKSALEHKVPLSRQALDVLWQAKQISDGAGLVFPSQRGKALTDSTISKVVRENGIAAVPHGMRSSFRDWASECSNADEDICELALAHVYSDRTKAAYKRTDLFEKRRELMQQWADHILSTSRQ